MKYLTWSAGSSVTTDGVGWWQQPPSTGVSRPCELPAGPTRGSGAYLGDVAPAHSTSWQGYRFSAAARTLERVPVTSLAGTRYVVAHLERVRTMDSDTINHANATERHSLGERARDESPLGGHAGWVPAADRPDPVGLLEEQDASREADLVPVRHGRMLVSPFTFYRGAAKIMAADLQATPRAGLTTQLCGDAHLSNFGVFASPERNLVFDLNDFDETLPGPFEYDVKRMSASFTIAARNNGYTASETDDITQASVRAYREAMAEFARMRNLDIWYAHLSEQDLVSGIKELRKAQKDKAEKKAVGRAADVARKNTLKARTRDSLQALSKLAEHVDGQYRIISQPPIVIPARELGASVRDVVGGGPGHGPRPVPRVPGHPAG